MVVARSNEAKEKEINFSAKAVLRKGFWFSLLLLSAALFTLQILQTIWDASGKVLPFGNKPAFRLDS